MLDTLIHTLIHKHSCFEYLLYSSECVCLCVCCILSLNESSGGLSIDPYIHKRNPTNTTDTSLAVIKMPCVWLLVTAVRVNLMLPKTFFFISNTFHAM